MPQAAGGSCIGRLLVAAMHMAALASAAPNSRQGSTGLKLTWQQATTCWKINIQSMHTVEATIGKAAKAITDGKQS